MKYTSVFLKAALFATGLAGIVSEYTLSTLATYFLGDSVFQFTMIVSIMLFSMGLGSRLSKGISGNLLERFVTIEFILSVVASNVTVIVYSFFAFYGDTLLIIYGMSILIGLLIGMEIPIVIRMNEQFESLKVNISSSLENDYYGSLVGGVFFAFVGLPYLGLTYTPLVLGVVNFSVAILFTIIIWPEIHSKTRKKISLYAGLVVITLSLTGIFSQNIVEWGDRIRYKDQVVYSEQTKYQKIVLTYSEGNYWLFLNGYQQLSTLDEERYHDPLVHSVMSLHRDPKSVLVLGGGDGAAVRELLKYAEVDQITLVDLDERMTVLASTHPVLLDINKNSLNSPKVNVINDDGFTYMEKVNHKYDVIIADFPDPRTVDLGRLYTREFYWLCYHALKSGGFLITQAGSPYYAEAAFQCIQKTMSSAGFQTLPIHNQVLTLGEWGWVIGAKDHAGSLKNDLQEASIRVSTDWMTHAALTAISSFGKQVFPAPNIDIKVNRLHDPVLYRYYLDGRWDVY
jgi:spermidine synthase